MVHALALTIVQLGWSALWGMLHARIRKGRRYASGRCPAAAAPDAIYRRLNPLLFGAQLAVSVACLWSNSPWLLPFHSQLELRWLGAALLIAGLWLTHFALRHLGENYSPCYDSLLPRALVTTGPYAWIRHPMYLAKLLAGAGTVLLSGSLWLVPSALYLFVVTVRALRREDAELIAHFPGYATYAARTRLVIPYCL
ncbi:MAG: isoprenylcysteine carboxylmethyltransferase family protein [Myxococcales bacterium]|nr:MAG: isoprenylcysteine carboxylmethyltransferase family protein [Myxococcales bacterium]